MTEPTPRRRRWPWILAALLVALPLAAFVALRLLLDPASLRPRFIAAVEQATGRSLRLGHVGLALSLRPTLVLGDVALANAPGGSQPQMLTIRRAEVQVALLPLFSRRVEIARIVLDGPKLLLEADAQGRGNWVFARVSPPDPAPGAPSDPNRAEGAALPLSVGALRVRGGRVTWRQGEVAETIAIPALDASAPGASPATARGTLALGGQEVAVDIDESTAVRLDLSPGEMSLHHVRIVHGSPPNASDNRRIGFAIRYIPTSVRQLHGEDSATLVRGVDRYNSFGHEPRPLEDMQPEMLQLHRDIAARNAKILYRGTKIQSYEDSAAKGAYR